MKLATIIITLVTLTILRTMIESATNADVPATEAAALTIAAVSVKLPPFWPQDPEVWLMQVEAQFANKGTTVQKSVISLLSPDVTMEVRDLLLKPPTDNPYNMLLAQLIKCTAASKLGSADSSTTLDILADMPDKIMEVATLYDHCRVYCSC